VPALSGPSGLARQLNVSATPDRITQDGVSQSAIQIQAIGPDGRALSGLAIRVDMEVGGQLADYGTLSARTIVTGSDGIARATYTAPPPPPPPADTTVTTVAIRAIPVGTDAQTASIFSAQIRLMPKGVILPPADTPTPLFTISPVPVALNVPSTFDASASCPGPASNGVCQPSTSTAITGYLWNFGDGTSAAGRVVTHTYTTTGTFNGTLTVTNDRGVSASAPLTITPSSTDPFTGDWIASPPIGTVVNVAQSIFFNASQVQSSAGHQVTQFDWNFGDGDPSQPTSGSLVTHSFASAGAYSVVLTVVDDLGRRKVFPPKVVNVSTGNPTATFISAVADAANHIMQFDASASTAVSPASIVSYQWNFGDPTSGTNTAGPSGSPLAAHTFSATNAVGYPVRLTVTDNIGRSTTITLNVVVP
jgi:PKD repeat protein